MTDLELMALALEQARAAAREGEVPVGAVVARRGEPVSAAHNRREGGRNALYHAELLAIDAACRALGGWRLWECELFVTLEPCPMCAGAIVNSRIRRVVYGARDPKAGCCGSVIDLCALPSSHRPAVEQGLCEAEAAALLAEFFAQMRLHPRPRWKKPAARPGPCAGANPQSTARPAPRPGSVRGDGPEAAKPDAPAGPFQGPGPAPPDGPAKEETP